MYHLNSTLPAPYELNSQPMASNANAPEMSAMARGGRAKHKKILAHFSPKELHEMDHLQGHTERCPKTGLRSYSHLEELLKNPHILGTIHRHAHAHREHHAMGGDINNMAHQGRFGDTEMALIGPHTHHLFHQLAGRSTTNPNTGHPEFWSIGGALSGLGNAVKGAAATAGRGISSAAQAAGRGAKSLGSAALTAGRAAAPHVGTALSNFAPMAAQFGTQYLANRLSGQPQEPFNPEDYVDMLPESMQGLARAGASAYNARRGGANMQQSFGQGLSQFGQGYGGALGNAMQGFGGAMGQGQNLRAGLGAAASRVGQGYGGALGQSLQSAGQSFGSGQNMGQSLGHGLTRGFQSMGGREGLMNSSANILRGYGAPGGMRGAAQREAQGYMQRALPQYSQQNQYQNPYDDQESGYEDQDYGY
jgi:hypothetical protein